MYTEEKIDYHNLLIKLFAREISDNEMVVLKSWLEGDPGNRHLFNEENELWQETNVYLKRKVYNTDVAWTDFSSKLGFGKKQGRYLFLRNRNNFSLLVAAATLAFVFVIGGISYWIGTKSSLQHTTVVSTSIATHEREKAHLFLSDSTEIILNSGSTLQYDNEYNLNSRKVKFTGEAFFNVRTNPDKPFVVKLNGMEVCATGTRFNICSFEDEDRVEATLEQGKITVSIEGREPLSLKSGQQVVYSASTNKVEIRDVPIDTYSSWKENRLRFIDAPLEEVLRRIGRKYDVEFGINNNDLLKLKFTATFLDEPVDEVMKMLASVSPITYEITKFPSINDKQFPREIDHNSDNLNPDSSINNKQYPRLNILLGMKRSL